MDKKEYFTIGMSKKQLMDDFIAQNPKANIELIGKAYDFAKEAHHGQKRDSGEDFFVHLTDTAYILAHWKQDSQTICAGLLHDVLEDTKVKKEALEKEFGSEIADMVESVTKMQSVNLEISVEEKAESLRKIFFATAKDIRVILIKLADRLQNMRTLKYKQKKEQIRISKDTFDIYVPVAYKLGMYVVKSELEDICMRFVLPDVYQDLKKKIAKKRIIRELEVRKVIRSIRKKLAEKGVENKVYGRAKNFYSIYRKMIKKNIPFEEVRDLMAIRVITNSVDDCYRALGVIHSTWTPIPNRFDDYIATPKPNMYQSLHTEIMFNKRPVEVQIRTWDMHHVAEEGVAAHWRYSGTDRDKKFDRRIAWLKQILDWKRSDNARDFIESVKVDLFKDEIFVLTPKGDPIPLPEKATPVDFAYMVHTDIGNHCVRAKVNNVLVPLEHELDPGDVVEIITSKNAKPSRSWLKIVKSNQAKVKIRQALGIPHDDFKHEDSDEVDVIERIDARGLKKSALRLPRCCKLRYGDEAVGFMMKDGKVTIHKSSCPAMKDLSEKRKVQLKWKDKENAGISTVTVELIDRVGLFTDIAGVFTRELINIRSVNTKNIKDKYYVTFEIEQTDKISGIVKQLKQIRNVTNVIVK